MENLRSSSLAFSNDSFNALEHDFQSRSKRQKLDNPTSSDTVHSSPSSHFDVNSSIPEEEKKKELCETSEENRLRFLMELEFVQCLANPLYLHLVLAQGRYFQDNCFINYLKYLLYWKRQPYVKYIVYPHCLRFLELLQEDSFRKALTDPKFVDCIHQQQYYHWQYYRNKRLQPSTGDPASSLAVSIPPSSSVTSTSMTTPTTSMITSTMK